MAFSTQAQKVSKEMQIKLAVLAAPEGMRDSCTVLGYDEKGTLTTLRKGYNKMICLGDDPSQKGLSVACYQENLEPFMKRGRELKKEGKDFKTISDAREAEVKAGTLKMPTQPSTLFVYSATDENVSTTGDVKDGYLRYVIYIPYATSETTGLPLKPDAPGMPWIMDPGTHRAHIMINPAKQ